MLMEGTSSLIQLDRAGFGRRPPQKRPVPWRYTSFFRHPGCPDKTSRAFLHLETGRDAPIRWHSSCLEDHLPTLEGKRFAERRCRLWRQRNQSVAGYSCRNLRKTSKSFRLVPQWRAPRCIFLPISSRDTAATVRPVDENPGGKKRCVDLPMRRRFFESPSHDPEWQS